MLPAKRRCCGILPHRHVAASINCISDAAVPVTQEALDEPFRAFPSWFLRITCARCGQQRMFSETHAAGQRDMLIRDIIARMRHDGCGDRAGKVELLTGIEGASSRPVRRIVLVDG